MAKFKAFRSIDYIGYQSRFGTITSSNDSSVKIKLGRDRAEYRGNFDTDRFGRVDGRVKAYTEWDDGKKHFQITGLREDASAIFTGVGLRQRDSFDGRDVFVGSKGRDRLAGYDGKDRMSGGKGNDVLDGGEGNDRVYGNKGNDTLFGGSGADRLYGGTGNDLFIGGLGSDRVIGGGGNDRLFGGEKNTGQSLVGVADTSDDYLSGGDGKDRLYGGAGDDQLRGGKGADRLYGEAGDDLLYGGSGNDLIYGDFAPGSSGLAFVFNGSDRLFGGAGNDKLFGGGGDDRLDGNSGNDSLTGGAGNDVFVAGDGRERTTITDFDPSRDKIDVAGYYDPAVLLGNARQTENGVEIRFGPGDSLVLENTNLIDLVQDIFI